MALQPDDIRSSDALLRQIRNQSHQLLRMFHLTPRLATLFATRQRWLMSHIGLALHFATMAEGKTPHVPLTRFINTVKDRSVASRNTADAFAKELVHYRFLHQAPDPDDRRRLRLTVAPAPLQGLAVWLRIHLACLDALVGGRRVAALTANPDLIRYIQPQMTQGFLENRTGADPDGTVSLFSGLDNGAAVMDWMITSLPDVPDDTERVSIGPANIVKIAAMFGLSRSHLSRKLKEAEHLGSIGWEGRRGRSSLWVSRTFRDEHAQAQADKLSVIDHAFEAAMRLQAQAGYPAVVIREARRTAWQSPLELSGC